MSNPTNHEHLHGIIERITYHSPDTGFCVLQVKVRNHHDLLTVVGACNSPTPGEYVDCQGDWVHSREYGRQFKARQIQTLMPTTEAGIEKYLGSGLIKGIGPHFAKTLVDHFGLDVFHIIEEYPEQLLTLPGIGKTRYEQITQGWTEQRTIRNIMVFLQSHGVGTARAVRIYKTYGDQAIERVRENPYRLAQDIHGIGFKSADQLAMKLGIPPHSIARAKAGVRHVLQEHASRGHCALPADSLTQYTHQLLEIPLEVVQQAIIDELKERRLVFDKIQDQPHLFLPHFHHAELQIADNLKRLMSQPLPWINPISPERAIPWVEEKTGLTLSQGQKEAIRLALINKILIITGGPGVGKTTLVNSILHILRAQTDRILLAAPTGRAAKRLSESTGLEAKTLHRLLEFEPKTFQFRKNAESPLFADWIVIDEVSMVDVMMMHHLLKAIPDRAGLLIVGDVDQLPSVNAGSVLSDLIRSHVLTTVRLTEIFRQAQTSEIVLNAHRINRGQSIYETEGQSDFYYLPCENAEVIAQKLEHLVSERIPNRFGLDPIREIQILAPMNRGSLGVRQLNDDLQKLLNPNPVQKITRFGSVFAVGDKVIQTVNNYDKEVFNGDIGFIEAIDTEANLLTIRFEQGPVVYEADELDEVFLAYATTIHKAQGSEYPAVIIPLAMQHYTLLQRNLLYTGVTRAKRLMILLAEPKALHMAIKNLRNESRITNLSHQLRSKVHSLLTNFDESQNLSSEFA